MTEPFLIFQSFTDAEVAEEVADKLRQNDIPFLIEDTSSPLDPVIIGNGLASDIRIKLRQGDFQRAHSILEHYYDRFTASVDKDYYLFDFTDDELYEIIEKSDEWGHFDYKLAQKLLKDRGKEVETGKLDLLKSQRLQEIAKPEAIGNSWIVFGYVLTIFCPLGIFFGSTILSMRKTLPNGNRVYFYDDNARKHAKWILVISSILTSIIILLAILSGGD